MVTRFVLALVLINSINGCKTEKLNEENKKPGRTEIALVIHGGAGTIRREEMSPEREKAYHVALKQALEAGYTVLENGGTSVDAVVTSISIMEDSPLFNAGKGAVFSHAGKNELDASIMEGNTLMAGAVAGVATIKNPIKAAHAVMTKSSHVMLTGNGADQFAKEQGLEIVDQAYFFDSARYQQFLELSPPAKANEKTAARKEKKFGTVGAVALDQLGNIAAGTSTGGMTNKKYGRVGDSPIIGAGTYAKNISCGVSATGWGEYFIRLLVAHDISAMMEYAGLSLEAAADSVIMKKLPALGGDGGIIALDRSGNISMTFNTDGMYRGFIRKKGEAKTFIYKDEDLSASE
ncbi:MAG: isoaspartyl peptidase/L-asparaginase [Cyclobacteriaceae bacterium]